MYFYCVYILSTFFGFVLDQIIPIIIIIIISGLLYYAISKSDH